jgi:hypothetical protein
MDRERFKFKVPQDDPLPVDSAVLIHFSLQLLPISTGILIDKSHIITSYHALQGISVKQCHCMVNSEKVAILGILESNPKIDYCILRIDRSFPELQAPLSASLFQASEMTLLYHAEADSSLHKAVGEGYSSTNYEEMAPFLITDLIATGGGYFNRDGELFGIHQVIGSTGSPPEIKMLSLHSIVQKNSNSVLSYLLQNKDISRLAVSGTDPLPMEVLSCPFQLHMNCTMILIPCSPTVRLNRFVDSVLLTPDREKWFYLLLKSLKYEDFACVPLEKRKKRNDGKVAAVDPLLIKSVNDSGFSSSSSPNNNPNNNREQGERESNGIKLEFLSVSEDEMFLLFRVRNRNSDSFDRLRSSSNRTNRSIRSTQPRSTHVSAPGSSSSSSSSCSSPFSALHPSSPRTTSFTGTTSLSRRLEMNLKRNNKQKADLEECGDVIAEIELGMELLALRNPLKDRCPANPLLRREEYERELIRRICFGFLRSYRTKNVQRICLNI